MRNLKEDTLGNNTRVDYNGKRFSVILDHYL